MLDEHKNEVRKSMMITLYRGRSDKWAAGLLEQCKRDWPKLWKEVERETEREGEGNYYEVR